MMWMPLRAVKMYGRILGFQRLVWCPKWTPASRSCFKVTCGTLDSSLFHLRPGRVLKAQGSAGRASSVAGTGRQDYTRGSSASNDGRGKPPAPTAAPSASPEVEGEVDPVVQAPVGFAVPDL